MPAGFDKCQAEGGRIRRFSGPSKKFNLSAGEYVNVCFLGDKAHRGYVKKAKTTPRQKKGYRKVSEDLSELR